MAPRAKISLKPTAPVQTTAVDDAERDALRLMTQENSMGAWAIGQALSSIRPTGDKSGRGIKQIGESLAFADDPFVASGMYIQSASGRRILVPPLGEGSLSLLTDMIDESNILPQCVAAYETNIEGFGHRFDIIKGLEDEDGNAEKADKNSATKFDGEAEALEEFFDYCNPDGSFVELRKQKRRDQEACGFAAWEVIRAKKGDVSSPIMRLSHIPAHTLRMTVFDQEVVTIQEKRRVGGTIKTVPLGRRFRTYVQIQVSSGKRETRWFKDFNDPRPMDWKTGIFLSKGNKSNLANEVIIFRSKYHPKSPYSMPRWIGNLPSVLGSRASEEVNLLYFDNKGIPPLAILVSGGTLTRATIKRLEQQIADTIKGRGNFHNILIVESQPAGDTISGTQVRAPNIKMEPLTNAQLRDAMFMGYDEANRTKSRSSFRLPPLFVGQSEEYTRATAEASAHMAEEQVFRPERMEFDYRLNRWLMPEIESNFHLFVSNGPNVTLNDDLIAVLTAAEAVGSMTPNIGREILTDILERAVPQITEPWGDEPFGLTLAAAQPQPASPFGGGFGGGFGGAPPENWTPPPSNKAPEENPDEIIPPNDAASKIYAEMARKMPNALKVAVIREVRSVVQKELALRKRHG